MTLPLQVSWDGPYTPRQVVTRFTDGGSAPGYEAEDYGLYQIYGRHILGDPDALLYIGKAAGQTFSARFRRHESWLAHEWRPTERPLLNRHGKVVLVHTGERHRLRRRDVAPDDWE